LEDIKDERKWEENELQEQRFAGHSICDSRLSGGIVVRRWLCKKPVTVDH
jgi:hypothetical protein